MANLYLHMGLHKTASSSFQETCAQNIPELLSQGFVYPIFYYKNQHVCHATANHSISLYSIFTSDPRKYHVNIVRGDSNIERINSEYNKTLAEALSTGKDVIISGEDISLLNEYELNNLLAALSINNHTIIPIACVRSPYEFHCSSLQQIIKGGWYCDLVDYMSQRMRITTLKRVFGDAVKFIPFRKMCCEHSRPIEFLLNVIGIDSTRIKSIRTNEGMSNVAVRIQNLLNKKHPVILNGRVNIMHKKIKPIKGDKFLLTKEELNVIQKLVDEDNVFFANELGADFCDVDFPIAKETFIDALVGDELEDLFMPGLSSRCVDFLRDQALLCEKKSDVKMAYELMALAYYGRPTGPLIERKVNEYKSILLSS